MAGILGLKPIRLIGSALLATAAAGLAAPAAAQSLQDKYWIEVSAYFPSVNTDATVAALGRPGTDIDLESDLGLNKHETLPAVYAGWRFTDRFTVAAEYYALDRNGSRVLSRDINFGDTTFPASFEVKSELHSDVYRLTLGYSFIKTDQAELGAALGLHATDFKIDVSGPGRIANAVGLQDRRENTKFLAPLPTLGVFGTYEPMPKVILTGRADYMSLKVGDYDGSIFNGQAAVGYRVWRNVDIGVAYRYVKYKLDIDKRLQTHLDYRFSGPSVFARVGFQ
ncbi:MAG: outer membrane beta-barrel protein [Phenylobacterium sp.]